jgi:hypothetical protein
MGKYGIRDIRGIGDIWVMFNQQNVFFVPLTPYILAFNKHSLAAPDCVLHPILQNRKSYGLVIEDL